MKFGVVVGLVAGSGASSSATNVGFLVAMQSNPSSCHTKCRQSRCKAIFLLGPHRRSIWQRYVYPSLKGIGPIWPGKSHQSWKHFSTNWLALNSHRFFFIFQKKHHEIFVEKHLQQKWEHTFWHIDSYISAVLPEAKSRVETIRRAFEIHCVYAWLRLLTKPINSSYQFSIDATCARFPAWYFGNVSRICKMHI